MSAITITITEDGGEAVTLTIPAEVVASAGKYIAAETTSKWEIVENQPQPKLSPRWASIPELLAARLRDALKPILERFPVEVEAARDLKEQRAELDRRISEVEAKAIPDVVIVSKPGK